MKKILVIDDSNVIRRVYKSKLENAGFSVEMAENGKEGIEKLKKTKPNLILLDIIMPESDGFEFLNYFHKNKKFSKIPVIVFSTLSQKSDVDKAFKLGVNKYLPKNEHSPNKIISEIKLILKM